MYLVDSTTSTRLASADELLPYFESACKPARQWRVGSEHELIGVHRDGAAPGADQIGRLLARFASLGWDPIIENGHTIALSRGDAQLTIEPGGQFELAARPVYDDRDFASDLRTHITEVKALGAELGITWLSIALRPFGTRNDIPWMPKQRYEVMRDYMPTVGTRGLDMMLRTATVQTNLDFSSERDCMLKLQALNSVTPMLTAIWANSPIVDGEATDYQSYRAWIWRDTDNARAGLPAWIWSREDAFAAYRDWALDVPMYFVHRGRYIAMPAGFTFRRYLAEGHDGMFATIADWGLHLSTLFPDVRLKKYLEVRGCDCGSEGMIAALGPFCRGITYDAQSCEQAIALTAGLSLEQRNLLLDEVPRHGFATRSKHGTLGDLAKELVKLAKVGLSRCAPQALHLLEPVEEITSSGVTQADRARQAWRDAGSVESKIAALALG